MLLRRVHGSQRAPRIIAEECSLTERRAAEAERELVEWKKAKFMEEHVGEQFDGLIISAQRFGLFVELTEMFVEGLVPIDTLPGDRYMYNENVRKIIGQRTRREFSIGDPVRIIVDRVDSVERKLQFAIIEPERPARPRSRATKRPVRAANRVECDCLRGRRYFAFDRLADTVPAFGGGERSVVFHGLNASAVSPSLILLRSQPEYSARRRGTARSHRRYLAP